MTVFAYARVSTDKQMQGDSLDQQRRQMIGYAQMRGLLIDQFLNDEGVSASIPLMIRPAAASMWLSMQAGDAVIAAKLDRMFRSALDTLRSVEELRKRGVALHLLDLGGEVTGEGLSRMMLTLVAAFAEMERSRIRERVAATKAHGRAKGRYLGGAIPFGYSVSEDGFLVEYEWRSRALEVMRSCSAAGDSLRRISDELARIGVKISHAGVKSVLEGETQHA